MKRFEKLVSVAAIVVFVICLYSFLLGSEVFEGQFKNDPIAWYFLAKGIFCSLSLALGIRALRILSAGQRPV